MLYHSVYADPVIHQIMKVLRHSICADPFYRFPSSLYQFDYDESLVNDPFFFHFWFDLAFGSNVTMKFAFGNFYFILFV